MVGAGSETSATLLDWAISELMRNPKIMATAQIEVREIFDKLGRIDEFSISKMKYLKAIIKETLRLHPPAPLLVPRECRELCYINGFEIPPKTRVIINAWTIGRDKRYWKEPENFMPERFLQSHLQIDYKGFNFEYIPFGAGRRICPGITFGVANAELQLAMLLYYFNWKHPFGIQNKEIDMTEEFGLTVRRKNHNWLIPIRSYCPVHQQVLLCIIMKYVDVGCCFLFKIHLCFSCFLC